MEYNYVEKTQRKYMLFYYSDRKLLFNPPHSANNDIFLNEIASNYNIYVPINHYQM